MNDDYERLLDSLNRRDFIRRAGGCGALTSVSLMSTLLSLRTTSCLAADVGPFNDYKALVCVFLFGGNDGYNMLVPNDAAFENYARRRSNMALEQEDLLPITDGPNGKRYGLHPSLRNIHRLYGEGNVAMVANVGSLIEPTTLADVRAKRRLPLGLYSHSDEQRHWQTSLPQARSGLVGWAGRVADVLTDASNDNREVSMNFSLNNIPIMLSGEGVLPYVVGNNGATEMADYHVRGTRGDITTKVTNKMLVSKLYSNLLQKTHASKRRRSIDAAIEFNRRTDRQRLSQNFPSSGIGRQLEMVARIIASRDGLEQKRQVFFVSRGGFDNHNELLNNQRNNLGQVDQAISVFYRELQDLGLTDQVTIFTASDFARTLSSNGNGTDHAWGSNHMMIGGAVQGGKIYGQYPENLGDPVGIVEGKETDLEAGGGRGRLIPTTAVDQYNAELAMWFGIPNDDRLKFVLPNIENFMRLGSGAPLGILS